jgi:plastocyanin
MYRLMMVALLLGASVSAQPRTGGVSIELSNFSFAPNVIRLRPAPTTLHLQNASSGGHSFSAPEFFAAARIDPRSASMVRNGMVEIPGHSAIDIELVPAAGQYRLKCTHTLHSAFGMKGTIIVN